MRYAVINSLGKVRNVIELDDGQVWPVPDGCTIVASELLNIGDMYEESE